MSNAMKAIVLSTFLAAGAALAADDASATTLASSDAAASVMRPGHIDVRGMIDTDILLVYVNLGAMAEVGVLPIGPGTLAVGGEVDYGFCGSLCLITSLASPIDIGERYFTPMARVSYHFPIEALKIASKVDFFGATLRGRDVRLARDLGRRQQRPASRVRTPASRLPPVWARTGS